jgi:LysM repeat protein
MTSAGVVNDANEVCPYLGLAGDPATHYAFPSGAQRCHAAARPVEVDAAKQARDCLTAQHVTCPRYHPPAGPTAHRTLDPIPAADLSLERVGPAGGYIRAVPVPGRPRRRRLARLILLASLLAIAGAGGLWFGGRLAAQLGGGPQPPASPAGALASPSSIAVVAATPSVTADATSTPQPTPSLTPTPTLPTTVGPTATVRPPVVYVVVRGDTLIGIARRFGVSVAAVKSANRIRNPNVVRNPNLIFAGQELVIPGR